MELMNIAYWLKPLSLDELCNLSEVEKLFYQASMIWRAETLGK